LRGPHSRRHRRSGAGTRAPPAPCGSRPRRRRRYPVPRRGDCRGSGRRERRRPRATGRAGLRCLRAAQGWTVRSARPCWSRAASGRRVPRAAPGRTRSARSRPGSPCAAPTRDAPRTPGPGARGPEAAAATALRESRQAWRTRSVGAGLAQGLNRGCHGPRPVESPVCPAAREMTLRLSNSLSRKLEAFQPRDPARTTVDVCGPTVYNYVRSGNARGPVVCDVVAGVLRRRVGALAYAGNITDVDDKINAAAAAQGVPISVITDRFAAAYREDMAALGVAPP